ncbi:MAG: YdcH family protein [Candidatus Thiodiazotropha sp.]
MKTNMDYLESLQKRHRRLNRLIDNCRAANRQEEMKPLKRIRLHLKDRIESLQRQSLAVG